MALMSEFDSTVTLTTAEATLADKTAVLLNAYGAALKQFAACGDTMTPRQRMHLDEAIANAVENAADFTTALTVA